MSKLLTLKTELECLQEIQKSEKNLLYAELESIIKKSILEESSAVLCRKYIVHGPAENHIYISFELGFFNETENRIDFGSDIICYFDTSKDVLQVNTSTCGPYSKLDTYQVQRLRLLNSIFDKVEIIETSLRQLYKNAQSFIKHQKDIYELETEIYKSEEQLKEEERKKISESLVPNSRLYYSEDWRTKINPTSKLFNDVLSVKSVSPKFVKFIETGRSINKQKIIDQICLGAIQIESVEE